MSTNRSIQSALWAEANKLIPLIPCLKGKKVKVRPLKGGLTNRNYSLDCEGARFVLRVMGENSRLLGIDRQAELASLKSAHALGIGPEVMAFFPERGALVTRFVTGRVLVPKALKSPAILRRVVASLRRYHDQATGSGRFSSFETVRRYYAESRKRKIRFPKIINRALHLLARIEEDIGVPELVRYCHNDLLCSNLVNDRHRVWILDWEYGGAGDVFFDLGNLAANNGFSQEQEAQLLKYYFGQALPAGLHRLRLMRLASDMREAMWGFLQTGISNLRFDYETYAHRHLKRFLHRAQHVTRSSAWD